MVPPVVPQVLFAANVVMVPPELLVAAVLMVPPVL